MKMEEVLGKLGIEELKSCFQSLLKSATCAVCLEVVRSQMVQCINGHIACSTCVSSLDKCPSCRQPFSPVQPSYLIQMLESLPWRRCNYRGCPSIEGTEVHAIFCEWKTTKCELCDWSGPRNKLAQHLISNHKFHKNRQTFIYKYYENEKNMHTTPFLLVSGHILWVKKVVDPEKTSIMVTFYCVPKGKPENNIVIELQSVSLNSKFTAKIEINPDPDVDTEKENFIAIPKYVLAGTTENGWYKSETTVKCAITVYEE